MSSRRKNISNILAMEVFNRKDSSGNWICDKYYKLDWILMRPSTRGSFKVKRKDVADPSKHWKGRILEFRKVFNGSGTVTEVLIQHVYTHKQIRVHDENYIAKYKQNSKFLNLIMVYFFASELFFVIFVVF